MFTNYFGNWFSNWFGDEEDEEPPVEIDSGGGGGGKAAPSDPWGLQPDPYFSVHQARASIMDMVKWAHGAGLA